MSIFTVIEAEFDKPAILVAVQVSVVPACGVSVLRLVVVQPMDEAIPDSGSETDQLTVTGPLFQPLPLALGATVAVITGGVVSWRKLAVQEAVSVIGLLIVTECEASVPVYPPVSLLDQPVKTYWVSAPLAGLVTPKVAVEPASYQP
jgi:hypothetical protein